MHALPYSGKGRKGKKGKKGDGIKSDLSSDKEEEDEPEEEPKDKFRDNRQTLAPEVWRKAMEQLAKTHKKKDGKFPCIFHFMRGGCVHGDKCKFYHEGAAKTVEIKK